MNTNTFLLFSDISGNTAESFFDFFKNIQKEDENIIELCSYGGDIYSGLAISQKIMNLQKNGYKFTAKIWGLAASSAADIALSCDKIEMARSAAIMVHSAWRDDGKKDRGIELANRAQLDIIHKRLPGYKEQELKRDQWYSADDALNIGLVDAIFEDEKELVEAIESNTNIDRKHEKLVARYVASLKYIAGVVMDEEKKEVVIEQKENAAEEVMEEKEVVEEKTEPQKDDIKEEIIEKIIERLEAVEKRLNALENPDDVKAACDEKTQENAKLASLYARISKVTGPAERRAATIVKTPEKALADYKAKFPNLDKLIDME